MLESPHGPATAETGLHFIANQQRLMLIAPAAEGLHVSRRSEAGAAALVSFQHHACDVARLHARLAQTTFEVGERGVGSAESVRERDLHKAGIEIHDPFLQSRNPSC